MRTTENIHGCSVMISSDEYNLLKRMDEAQSIKESELSPFFQEVADKLYRKSVLHCSVNNDEVVYYRNK